MSNKKIFEATRLMGANKYRLCMDKKDGKLLSTKTLFRSKSSSNFFPPWCLINKPAQQTHIHMHTNTSARMGFKLKKSMKNNFHILFSEWREGQVNEGIFPFQFLSLSFETYSSLFSIILTSLVIILCYLYR